MARRGSLPPPPPGRRTRGPRVLARRNVAGRILVCGLDGRDELKALDGPVVAWRAGDEAVEIVRIALRLHEGLPPAAGAAVEIRDARRAAVQRGDGRLALHGGIMDGPVAEIDQLLRMTHGKARVAAGMARIGRRGRGPRRRG